MVTLLQHSSLSQCVGISCNDCNITGRDAKPTRPPSPPSDRQRPLFYRGNKLAGCVTKLEE